MGRERKEEEGRKKEGEGSGVVAHRSRGDGRVWQVMRRRRGGTRVGQGVWFETEKRGKCCEKKTEDWEGVFGGVFPSKAVVFRRKLDKFSSE